MIKQNLKKINSQIYETAIGCGRKPESIKLMAVSKTQSLESIKEAINCGHRLFGENRIIEAEEKFSKIKEDCDLHIIGHLQSNKAKKAVRIAKCIQSVDKVKTARVIQKYAHEFNKNIDIFLEINTSGEESKNGFTNMDDFYEAIDIISDFNNITIKGLMTIAPFVTNEKIIRKSFCDLRNQFETTKSRYPNLPLTELSMGMSSDFIYAIKEGSTLIRVGTSIFGSRLIK